MTMGTPPAWRPAWSRGWPRCRRGALAMAIVLTDPVYAPPDAPGLLERAAVRVIRDPRDLPFLRLMATLGVTVVPTGLALYVGRLFPSATTWWLLAAVHTGLVIHFLGPFVLMLHNTSHRAL